MFLRNVLTWSTANAFGQVARVVQEFVVRVILPPPVMGVWNFIIVVRNFGATFDLDIIKASNRKLALLYGANDEENIIVYRSTAFYLHLFQKILISLGVFIYGLASLSNHTTLETVGVFSAGVMIFLTALTEAYTSFHQNAQRYVRLSKVLTLYWFVFALLMIVGAYLFQVPGLILATILTLVLQGVLLKISMDREGLGLERLLRWGAAKSLLGYAIPFKISEYPMKLFWMLDVLLVTKYFSLANLAIYSTAKLILSQASQIQAWITNVIIMRVTTLVGARKNRTEVGEELFKNILVRYLVIVPVSVYLGVIASRFVIGRFIPEYSSALELIPPLLLCLYFLPQTTVIRNIWMIDKRFIPLGVSNMVGLCTMGALFLALYSFTELSLVMMAGIYLLAHIVYFLYLLFTMGNELWGLRKSLHLVIYLCLSLSFVLVSLAITDSLARPQPIVSLGILANYLFTASLIVCPLVVFGLWKIGIVEYVQTNFRNRRKHLQLEE